MDARLIAPARLINRGFLLRWLAMRSAAARRLFNSWRRAPAAPTAESSVELLDDGLSRKGAALDPWNAKEQRQGRSPCSQQAKASIRNRAQAVSVPPVHGARIVAVRGASGRRANPLSTTLAWSAF